MYYSFGSLTWNFQLKLFRAPTRDTKYKYQNLENIVCIHNTHKIFSNVYLELAAACGAPPLLELGPGRARLAGQVLGRGGGGAARRTSSRCVTICHEVMSWLCDYVMWLCNVRTAWWPGEDCAVSPAGVSCSPWPGAAASPCLPRTYQRHHRTPQHTPANMHNIRRVIWITDLRL